jgi:hypothetical protein
MGRNWPEAAAHEVQWHVPRGNQQGRIGLGLASPFRRQGILVGLATQRDAGTLQGSHRAPGGNAAHDVSSVPFSPCGLHLWDEHRRGSSPGKV